MKKNPTITYLLFVFNQRKWRCQYFCVQLNYNSCIFLLTWKTAFLCEFELKECTMNTRKFSTQFPLLLVLATTHLLTTLLWNSLNYTHKNAKNCINHIFSATTKLILNSIWLNAILLRFSFFFYFFLFFSFSHCSLLICIIYALPTKQPKKKSRIYKYTKYILQSANCQVE